MQPHQWQYIYSLEQRLDKFTYQTREDVAKLTGISGVRNTNDPSTLINAILDNWNGNLEHILPRYGVTYQLVDKVRYIRNSVIHREGRFTNDYQDYAEAINSIDTLQNMINSLGQQLPAHQPAPQNRPTEPDRKTGQSANVFFLGRLVLASVADFFHDSLLVRLVVASAAAFIVFMVFGVFLISISAPEGIATAFAGLAGFLTFIVVATNTGKFIVKFLIDLIKKR